MRALLLCVLSFLALTLSGQKTIEGYVYQSGNRGFVNEVDIAVFDRGNEIASTQTDASGFFSVSVPKAGRYKVVVSKDYFFGLEDDVDVGDEKTFVKYEIKREPGYDFEITLAQARTDENVVVDQIKGALIEVYNNTTKESVLVLDDYQEHEFGVTLEKGNHYTILIRKEGFLAKRMEAFVNVEGCLLCFEGIGDIQRGRATPGVTENLTENNQNGVLLANVELDSLFKGKRLQINNLYYDLGKWDIKPQAEEELQKVITMMKDNPHLSVELGSHTDSRGTSQSNMVLSEKRARSAVSYLRSRGPIPSWRINFKGYGEEELVNGCGDGVDCEEEEHARNRRTELKIVGIEQEVGPRKSLATMKQEEFMDELLAEIQNDGVIKVTEQGTQRIPNPAINDQSVEESEEKTVEKVVEEIVEEIVEEVDDTGMENFRSDAKAQGEALPPDENLSGYTIVIKDQKEALASDDMLWKKHPKLKVQFDGNKFLYSIGSFENQADCKALYDSVKLEYSNAYMYNLSTGMKVD